MRQEIDDHQNAAGLQPGHESLGCQVWVVEVMEAETYTSHVEVEKLAVLEDLRVFFRRHAEVSLVCDHLIARQALVMTRYQERKFDDSKWKRSTCLIVSARIVGLHHLLRKINADALCGVRRKNLPPVSIGLRCSNFGK